MSERGSKWMVPLMHFILRGVRDGGKDTDQRLEFDGRKIEMIGETDWWGIRVTGGAIKTVFVFDHQCFHTVPVSSRGQLLTVYVKNESILSLWFMLHPPPPNSTPPPLLPQWPDIPA